MNKRKTIRLKDYDYSNSGLYYITICTECKQHLFGNISNYEMTLSEAGILILKWFNKLESKFHNVKCFDHVIMPNHIHFIIEIDKESEDNVHLGQIIQWYKTMTTNDYIQNVKSNGWKRFEKRLWQRNYYEHIIRDNISCNLICDYIAHNVGNWQTDHEL